VLLDEVDARPGPTLSPASVADGAPPLRVTLPVAGAHQARNAAVAVAIARTLGVEDAAIVRGLAQVTLPARMEVVLEGPTVIVDGAHTPASAQAARDAVLACFPGRRVHLVIGVLEEKDVRGILAPLLPLACRVVVSGVASPRAMPTARLGALVRETFAGPVLVAATAADALALARDGATGTDLVLVTGSTYLSGAARTAARAYPGFLGGPPPPG
jgi:dihydrofolate synthase/folylpolyglutamate synthase